MKSTIDYPIVLFPIETASRELNSNLVLACVLANRGCRVVVGHKEACDHIARHSVGVVWAGKDAFHLKTSPESDTHFADRVLKKGSGVLFFQEEGGIFPASEWSNLVLEKHRIEFIRKRHLNRVCVWGKKQLDLLSQHGVAADTIRVTGCPRLDLCLPRFNWIRDPRTTRHQIQLRPFILMCTRFTNVAHHNGLQNFFSSHSDFGSGERFDLRWETWRRDVHDMADFVALAKSVAVAFPDLDIVLRPHPSEDIGFYEAVFKPFPRVFVCRVGAVLDWIRLAEIVIHCNCTTGIEAVLAGRQVVNFLPSAIPRGNLDKEVAREAGAPCSSIDEGIGLIGTMLYHAPETPVWSTLAKSILNNLAAEAIPLLADEVLSVAYELGIDGSHVVLPPAHSYRDVLRRLAGWPARRGSDYIAAKRGPLDLSHVEMILDGCRSMGIGSGILRGWNPNYVVIDPP